MDGADLLALCADNLVFECNLVEGIKRNELVAFQYQGLKDLVDFAPIPWRNGKFDPDALATAIETNERAEQSLERGASTGKADARLLRLHYLTPGLWPATSRTRVFGQWLSTAARLLPRDRHRSTDSVPGEVEVIFTVDLFNEGLDVPELETVLMLRPTESPVIFLQQLGRGLRKAESKDHLRSSTSSETTGASSTTSDAAFTRRALGRHAEGRNRRRPHGGVRPAGGCSVDYDLEAVDLMASLMKARSSMSDVLADYCREFFDDYGYRPSALQAFRAQLNPRTARAERIVVWVLEGLGHPDPRGSRRSSSSAATP